MAVNNDCLNSQEILDAVIAAVIWAKSVPKDSPGLTNITQITQMYTHTDRTTGSQITLTLLYLIEGSKTKKRGREI